MRPLAGAALTASLLAAGVAPAAAATPAPPEQANVTALLSVRRDPAWIESTLARQRLTAALAPILSDQLGTPAAPSGCVEVLQGPEVLYSDNPLAELAPASTMKLLTSTALLDRLGPDYRLTTRVEAQAPSGGVVHGDLYLVGGGDPRLMTDAYAKATDVAGFEPDPPVYTSLDQLAAQVKQAGVRMVTGSVSGDDSRFDSQRSVPTWQPVYIEEGDVAPLSALEVNDDTPPAMTPPGPPHPDPALNAAAIFTTLLRDEGVAVAGKATAGTAPSTAVTVATIQSPPLSTEVQTMLRVSDDTAAELLTKELGRQETGTGSTAAGTAAIRADLQSDGLPVGQLVNLDGSGLDRGDRVTCNLLVAALRRAGPDGTLAAGLPVAAKTGTLFRWSASSPAAGRLVAKTGSLEYVAALAGFLTSPPAAPTPALSAPLVFATIVNGRLNAAGAALADKVATALATYPSVPPLAAVAPLG